MHEFKQNYCTVATQCVISSAKAKDLIISETILTTYSMFTDDNMHY